MISERDKRRLRDGESALSIMEPNESANTDSLKTYLNIIGDAIAAMQSLDDLGPDLNEKAFKDEQELLKRYERVKSLLIKDVDSVFGAIAVIKYEDLFLAIMGPKGLSFPGGKCEKGESPFETAYREVLEEVSIKIIDKYPFPPTRADNGMLTYAYAMMGTKEMTRTAFGSSEGISCWVSGRELLGPFARFPKYNKFAIEMYPQIHFNSDGE